MGPLRMSNVEFSMTMTWGYHVDIEPSNSATRHKGTKNCIVIFFVS